MTTPAQTTTSPTYQEPHRPQCHFTPPQNWMNDPNGLVYHKGVYHLFYQQNPNVSGRGGQLHWGHATSRNLMHWEHQPIALSPDSLGVIYSGSAVVDTQNTSGFGRDGQTPLVAIFTHHNNEAAATTDTFENQSIAYSLDDGQTWTPYDGNPVLTNPGVRDFRDPKVFWYAPGSTWVMALAVKDHVAFYGSPNLRDWTHLSDFGHDRGAHGGVWECPELLPMTDADGRLVWVLIVSVNPGGPNGGSATQYFVGDWDGTNFTATHDDIRWIDYGPDNYAGVTWANVPDRCLLIAWMSSWRYAGVVPTDPWRGAMTIPRQLRLQSVGDSLYVASQPVDELRDITGDTLTLDNVTVDGDVNLSEALGSRSAQFQLTLESSPASLSVVLSNAHGEQVVVGYDDLNRQYFVDRTGSGDVGFHPSFARVSTAPRIADSNRLSLTILVDVSSVEVFADGGLTCLTSLFFPSAPLDTLTLHGERAAVTGLHYAPLTSVWEPGA